VTTLRIGTRGSKLALWQANAVSRLLTEQTGVRCELVIIRTSGDEPPDPPSGPAVGVPSASGGPAVGVPPASGGPALGASAKAAFVKEIEDALLQGHVDLAVHSGKDLSAEFPEGLILGATLAREDPRDAILLPDGEAAASLGALRHRLGAQPRFGTSSVRRTAQLTRLFPGATFVPIRGNVDTRLRKLDAGGCDAGVLACAGLRRLGLADRISLAVSLDDVVPAPGQGIITVQVGPGQPHAIAAAAAITDRDAFDALSAERAVVHALGGGCQMPLGAHARLDGDDLWLVATVIAPDGSQALREERRGPRAQAVSIGRAVAEALLSDGAAALL
jgi:hydroxymethylbilane synthase